MRTPRLIPIAGATLAFALVSLPAQAGLSISPVPGTTDTWDTEAGQSIPTGTAGYVGGTLVVTGGAYTFTYGPATLLAGATGHGDSILPDEFWVGANEAAAEAAGHVFCTQAGDASCGVNALATTVGQSFTLLLAPGPVSFGFEFGTNNANELLNGQTNDLGAYLAQIGLGTTANASDGRQAYLGLSDRAYPSLDHDFQDLTVQVTVPEPITLSLFGAGLAAGAVAMRRRKKKTA